MPRSFFQLHGGRKKRTERLLKIVPQTNLHDRVNRSHRNPNQTLEILSLK